MGVLTFPDPLLKTTALLEAATDPLLTVRRLRWPAMERILRLLRTYFAAAEENPLASREMELVAQTWAWVRVCLDGPVPTSHETTGIARLQHDLAVAEAVLQNDRVTALRSAIEEAVASEHPAANAIADLISTVDRDIPEFEDGRPSCVLIVRGVGLRAVQEWVNSENLCADVVTANQARTFAPWPHAILFGPPERYVSSAWLQGAQAAASAGWLLFAPAAPAVTVMSWAGHRQVSAPGYAPWQGAPTAPIHFETNQQASEEIQPVIEDFVPDIVHDLPLARVPSFEGEDELRVEAQGIQFQLDGRTLLGYFSAQVGSKPLTVMNDGGIDLVRVPVTAVEVGDCLLFKTSVAGVDALDKTTAEWFLTHHSSDTHRAAVLQQVELKQSMTARLGAVGRRQVVNDLIDSGMERQYAQMLPPRLLDAEFIAPQHYPTYEQLCRAIKTESTPAHFALLKTLRTARRQAGLMLSRRIASRLGAMPELPSQLRDSGGLVLDEDGVEGVALLVVRNIAPEQVSVPASRLGALITEDGRPWHR